MIRINENYLKLQATYLFTKIARRVSAFQQANPDTEVIKLGIGDVTRSLPRACIEAFHQGVDDLSGDDTFHGYGPEKGYSFLRDKIAANYWHFKDLVHGIIFISDRMKPKPFSIRINEWTMRPYSTFILSYRMPFRTVCFHSTQCPAIINFFPVIDPLSIY